MVERSAHRQKKVMLPIRHLFAVLLRAGVYLICSSALDERHSRRHSYLDSTAGNGCARPKMPAAGIGLTLEDRRKYVQNHKKQGPYLRKEAADDLADLLRSFINHWRGEDLFSQTLRRTGTCT
jgi:hypothetical protein